MDEIVWPGWGGSEGSLCMYHLSSSRWTTYYPCLLVPALSTLLCLQEGRLYLWCGICVQPGPGLHIWPSLDARMLRVTGWHVRGHWVIGKTCEGSREGPCAHTQLGSRPGSDKELDLLPKCSLPSSAQAHTASHKVRGLRIGLRPLSPRLGSLCHVTQ